MENVLLRNKSSEREMEFVDFTSFILWHGIELEENMIYMTADEYLKGDFDNAIFADGTENANWDALEKILGMDFEEMEENFKSSNIKDNENTVIATIGEKSIAILVE